MKLAYYTQTEGFPDVKITKSEAHRILARFGKESEKNKLDDIWDGFVQCSDQVKVWSEEA